MEGDREPSLVTARFPADRNDRFLIEEFARVQRSLAPCRERGVWEIGNGTSPQATEASGSRGWAALFLLPPMVFVGWNQATHNFGVLQPQRIYRSGQMPAGALSRTLRDHQIRTVLNLRGQIRESRGIAMSSPPRSPPVPHRWIFPVLHASGCRESSCEHCSGSLDTCDYPAIVHCSWGSERTGLARPSQTLAACRNTCRCA